MHFADINVLLVYSPHITPRLNYILKIFFGNNFILTDNREIFFEHHEIKINYSFDRISLDDLWIQPCGLLFQDDVKQQIVESFTWNTLKVFFKTEGNIPFDIFSASFYLITCYEEYLPHIKDEYGRYSHVNSLAFRENFLNLPLVNLWMKEFKKLLKAEFPSYNPADKVFTFIPTYDIDIAYAYLHKPVLNNLGGFYKELFTGKWKQLSERANVFRGSKKDPFDTYQWLDNMHVRYKLKPIYFFLIAERRKSYDKNISPHNKAMHNLIQQHTAKYEVGIHPSWQSGDDEKVLSQEIQLLSEIAQKVIANSRQHYIRMDLPGTYRRLIENGIKDEHSMGYGSINGFRNSYCMAHQWFDLEKNKTTNLIVHPFCYMEANSFF